VGIRDRIAVVLLVSGKKHPVGTQETVFSAVVGQKALRLFCWRWAASTTCRQSPIPAGVNV
jgi:hypothetical protein